MIKPVLTKMGVEVKFEATINGERREWTCEFSDDERVSGINAMFSEIDRLGGNGRIVSIAQKAMWGFSAE